MSSLNMSAFQSALKRMYPHSRIENLTFRSNVAYAMLPKEPDVGGESWSIVVHYEDGPGRSAKFNIAQANKAGSKKVDFRLTAVEDYSLASITGKVWAASKGNTKAFLTAAKSELDAAFNTAKRSCGISVFRNGTGSIGVISSGTTIGSTTLTLSNRSDINNFGAGQYIVFSDADGGTLRDNGARRQIESINRSAGSMVLDDVINASGSVETGDYIYIEGDAQNGTGNALERVSGLDSWLPTTAPTAGDSFFSVDRSVDVTRLAGNRINASGMTVEEALIEAGTIIAEQGGEPDCCFVPFLVWKQLMLELGTRKVYREEKIAGVSFKGVEIICPGGTVTVYADRNCPAGKAYMLTKSSWRYYSIGNMPAILNLDDVGTFLREASADGYELRVGGYPQVGCMAPVQNGVIYNLPTTYAA